MANWQRTVRLNPEWDQAKDGEITCQQLAKSISAKLRMIQPFKSELEEVTDSLAEIIDHFDALAEDGSAGIREIDCAMQELYDWGDMRIDDNWNGKKVCWIDTMTPASGLQGDRSQADATKVER